MRQTRAFCLASSSPRRKALMDEWGLAYSTFCPQVNEQLVAHESPATGVMRLAEAKALTVQASANYQLLPKEGCLILAGDTLVSLSGQPLGKPADVDEAKHMLSALSGKTHQVLSSYCLLEITSNCISKKIKKLTSTDVHMQTLPREWIEWYAQHPEAQDKAGAYALQGIGGSMVEWIHGSYTNVIGFPMERIIWDMLANGWLTF